MIATSRSRKPKRSKGMTDQSNKKRIVALDVHPQSFGFIVFEGPNQMLDWSVRSFRSGANAVKIPVATKFLALLDESGSASREELRNKQKCLEQ
jgi:hypothetical protein